MRAWIQTFNSRSFKPMLPEASDLDPLDIAHALSNQCRFSGHCKHHYSVAQHSILVSIVAEYLLPKNVSDEETMQTARAGLLHDASEAYLVDIPSPLKQLPEFAPYRAAEKRLERLILKRFSLPEELPAAVKQADLILLSTEKRDLMVEPPEPWIDLPEPLERTIQTMTPQQAEQRFLERFDELGLWRLWNENAVRAA